MNIGVIRGIMTRKTKEKKRKKKKENDKDRKEGKDVLFAILIQFRALTRPYEF